MTATGESGPARATGASQRGHGAALREFLSLGAPSRPARVVVRVVERRRPARR